jgi:DNA transposition AAA+ family ATPase
MTGAASIDDLAGLVPDPTTLLVIDEADRLKIAGLEQTRSILIAAGSE